MKSKKTAVEKKTYFDYDEPFPDICIIFPSEETISAGYTDWLQSGILNR